MADLSKFILPVKNPTTGEITMQEFDIKGSGGGGGTAVIPVDPATVPTEEGALWITTT